MFLVCYNHDCRQTYPFENYSKDDRDVKCEKCGDTLISEKGEITISGNPYVVKTVDLEKYEKSKKRFGH